MKDVFETLMTANITETSKYIKIIFDNVLTIFSLSSYAQEFLKLCKERNFMKIGGEIIVLVIVLTVFQNTIYQNFVLIGIALFLFIRTFQERKKQGITARKNISQKSNLQSNDMINDSTEADYNPRVLQFSISTFDNVKQCLAEKHPKEAIRYLNECKGKKTTQARFTIYYADALIMLNNYAGALAKLNSMSEKQLRKKRIYKNVMIKKAVCYYEMNRYAEELDCYDKVIASNYKPEKYYFYRGKVKIKLFELYSYVKSAENTILHIYGSKQEFILSAIKDLDKALRYGDKFKAEILSYKGSAFFYLQDYQKSLDFLYESNKLKRNYVNNYVYFGLYYFENHNMDTAETYLEKAVSYHAKRHVPYLYLAKIFYDKEMYDKAISYAARSLAIQPAIAECHGIQGDCYLKKNLYVEAIACYTRAIERKPKENYFSSRALCYYNKREPEYRNAYNDILSALKIKDTELYRLNALVYKSKIDDNEGRRKGLEEVKSLVQPYVEKPSNYFKIGLLFESYGYVSEAEKYNLLAIEHNKKNDSAYYNLAIILRETGRVEEAVECLMKAIEIDPMKIKYLILMENCYRDLGDISNGIILQNEINNLKLKYLRINKRNGDVVYQIGKHDEAEKYYRLALKYMENEPVTLNNLACVLYCQERYEEAVKTLEKAIKQKEDYGLAYFNLGNCYLRMNNTKRNVELAKDKYCKAEQISPQFKPVKKMLASMNPSSIRMVIDTEE